MLKKTVGHYLAGAIYGSGLFRALSVIWLIWTVVFDLAVDITLYNHPLNLIVAFLQRYVTIIRVQGYKSLTPLRISDKLAKPALLSHCGDYKGAGGAYI
jgi:hypothetical protein